MIRPLGVAVLVILTQSACAPVYDLIAFLFPSEAATSAQAAAQPTDQPMAQSTDQPADQPKVGLTEATPLPRRKPETFSEMALAGADPQRLVGLDFDGTKALLGDPAARMEQPPAKVWAYASGGCMFSVFFYPSVEDQVFRVLAVEVTDDVDLLGVHWLRDPPDATPEAPPDAPKVLDKDDPVVHRCFAELLQQHEPNAG